MFRNISKKWSSKKVEFEKNIYKIFFKFYFSSARKICPFLRCFFFSAGKMHLFAGQAVKRERRKGRSCRQQTAYAPPSTKSHVSYCAALACQREKNGGRRYIKHDGTIASPVGSCLCCRQLPLSSPVPPLSCSALLCSPLSPSLSPTRFDAFKDVIALNVHNMLPILGEQPRHLGYRPVYVGFPYDL